MHQQQFSGHLPLPQMDASIRRYLEVHPLLGGLTVMSLRQALPLVSAADASKFVGPLNVACKKYDITGSVRRMAAFLGHIAHESGYLHNLVEKMNYVTTEQLLKIYSSTFKTEADARPYLRNPEALANKVYAHQGGNGNEACGDGWRYRGRGLIHLTHKGTYAALSKAVNVDFVKNPDLVAAPQYAALSAAWYWHTRHLNTLSDAENYQAVSKGINNSLKSFPAREAKRKGALEALCRVILVDIVSHGRRGFGGW